RLELQPGKVPLKRTEFHPSPGRTLQFRNHIGAHLRLKPRAGEVPASRQKKHQNKNAEGCRQQEPIAGRPRLAAWCDWTRIDATAHGWLTLGSAAPIRISLWERRSCSQDASSSFMRRWVSSSSILGETSTRGTSLTPDLRNSGSSCCW